MRPLLLAVSLLGSALFGSACVSFSNMQRAEVLEEGRYRLGFAPIAVGASRRDTEPELPLVASVRYGLGHDAEFSTRFWLVGAGVGAKYQFLKDRRFVASFAPELLGYAFFDRGHGIDLALPVLGGVNLGNHQLIVGPRVVQRWWTTSGTGPLQPQTLPGVVLGFDLATGHGFHVLPEVNLSWWPGGQMSFWTGTVGLYFDP